jgi:hypothetical protein
MEARITRRLSLTDAAEEGLEGAVYTLHHVLQDLTADLCVLRHLGFNRRKLGFLLIVADGDAALPPGFPALFDGGVIDVTTEHEGTIKGPLLFGSGLQLELEGLTYRLLGHILLAFLVLDVALERLQRDAAGRRDDVRIGPQRGQSPLQRGELLSQRVRAVAFEQLHQTVNAELRIAANEQMDVIGHDLQLDEVLPPALDLLSENRFEPFIYRWHEHLASVLRAEDDVISTDIDDVVVAAHVSHASSRTQ